MRTTDQHQLLDVCPEGEPWIESACKNCETTLAGHYCHDCGQPDKHIDPSLHDLIHELTHEFLHLDGKIVLTLKALVLSPGRLTSEFLAGRRARFIGPVRLYLTFSLIFFLLLAYAPGEKSADKAGAPRDASAPSDLKTGGPSKPSDTPITGKAKANAKGEVPEIDLVVNGEKIDPEETVDKELKRQNQQKTFIGKLVTKMVSKASKHGEEAKHQFLANLSRVMFVIVPLFAFGLRLAYRNRKRRYPSFVYFSLHFHTFVFLALALYLLMSLTRVPQLEGFAATVVLFWILVYLFVSLRRVFGGSKRKTIIRMIALGAFYMPCFVTGLAIAGIVTLLT